VGLSILIADEEDSFRRRLAGALDGHQVVEAASGAEALAHLRQGSFPLVIASLEMGGRSGRTLLEEASSLDPGALVVITLDDSRATEAARALRLGAHDCLVKSCDDEVLAAALRRAVRQATLTRENQALLESLKRNVESLARQNQRLEQLATRDGLTDLFNHRYFREVLDVELSRCRRYGRVLSLAFADIDHFKRYNDRHGHLGGDRLLASLGKLITRHSRKSTIVARYGGEEFVLLVPEANHEAGLQYAEKIRSLVESHEFVTRRSAAGTRITLSMGVATFPEDGTYADDLIKTADDRLYQAKRCGRNAICGNQGCQPSLYQA
jgi:diguanylate cyclase (GGDEF)-like protein